MIIVIVSVSSQKIVNSLIAVVITGGTWLLYHYIVAIRFGTPGIENNGTHLYQDTSGHHMRFIIQEVILTNWNL